MKQKNKDYQLLIRRICLIANDVIMIAVASFLALLLRFDCKASMIETIYLENLKATIGVQILLTILVFALLRIYNSLWEYASERELGNIVIACVISSAMEMLIMVMTERSMPRSFYVLYAICLTAFVGASRIAYRFIRRKKKGFRTVFTRKPCKNIMIVGAGEAGTTLIREIQGSEHLNYRVRCAIDDNKSKKGKYVRGVAIVGDRNQIVKSAEKYKIDKIFIALPRLSAKELQPILEICQQTDCEIKKVPGMYQLMNGEVSVSKMKHVAIEDLLGREPIQGDMEELANYIEGKTILVTGGGGSIGSELCRQIAARNPKRLIIFDVYENNAYDIQQELVKAYPKLQLNVLIGSVRDSRRLHDVFETYKPDVVYHAAAHKHVPLMEDSPNESIKNNVIGTYKTAYAAMLNGCKRFVLISTDKAVNPTNIMGASKRLCEMIIQSFDSIIKEGRADEIPALFAHVETEDDYMKRLQFPKAVKTEFVAVRFGNVLGSNGSVIPLFKKQIEAGGPVTVTHPDIIRYFMTIPEAVSLVLQAGLYAKGGEIFVLDMGSPVKIDTLARNLIRLSGHKPDEDIKIEYTGLRPGEKLYEEKLMAEEDLKRTANDRIHIGCPIPFDTGTFLEQLEKLLKACNENSKDIKGIVADMVPTYHMAEE